MRHFLCKICLSAQRAVQQKPYIRHLLSSFATTYCVLNGIRHSDIVRTVAKCCTIIPKETVHFQVLQHAEVRM